LFQFKNVIICKDNKYYMTSSSTIDSPVSSILQPLVNLNRIQSPQVVELSPTISDSPSRDTAVTLLKSQRVENKIEKEDTNTPPNAKPGMNKFYAAVANDLQRVNKTVQSMSMMNKFKAAVAGLVGVVLGCSFAKDGICPKFFFGT